MIQRHALFGISGICALILFLLLPLFVFAVDMEADQQCPPGGQVGQKCKDTTNGYTTDGHCTFINICKADSFPKSPGGGAKGGGASGVGGYRPASETPTPIPKSYYYSTSIASGMLNAAFSEVLEQEAQAAVATTTGGYFFTIENKEFLFEDDALLVVGEPLTAPDRSALKEMPFDTSAFVYHTALNPFPQRPTSSPALPSLPSSGGSGLDDLPTFGGYGGGISADTPAPEMDMRTMILYVVLPIAFVILLPLALYLLRKRKQKYPSGIDFGAKAKSISAKDISVARPLYTGSQAPMIWEDKGIAPK